MSDGSSSTALTAHEVLAAMLRITPRFPQVLLWRRAREPAAGCWALPGGRLNPDEDVEASIRRQLAQKVDIREVTHIEQLATFSAPGRVPGVRTIATAFLGLVPCNADPTLPADTAWHRLPGLPVTAFDHAAIIERAVGRLRSKLSYTNLGFAMAAREFTVSELRDLYSAALGYPVSATNLQRVLSRRGLLEQTGRTAASGPSGGRPAARYRFADRCLRVTDPFAVFRPPAR